MDEVKASVFKKRDEVGRPALVIALCAMITILEGVDLQSAGVAAPRLAPVFHMAPSALGWFFSISTFGMMVGAPIGGRLSDRFGRKAVLLASVATFGLGSIGCALADSLGSLLIARFLTGLGLGGALPNVLAIVVEVGIRRLRSFSIGVLHAGLPIGGAAASAVIKLAPPGNWQFIFWLGGIAPLLLSPFLAAWLPANSRSDIAPRIALSATRLHGIVFALFGEGRSVLTLMICVAFTCSVLFPYLLIYWLPSLLVSRGLSQSSAFTVQTVFGFSGAAGSLTIGFLMDRLPPPAVVLSIFGLLLLSLWGLAVAPGDVGASMIVGCVAGFAVAGAQASVYALAPTIYPAAVRGTGLGTAVSAGRIGAAAGPLLAGAMIGRGGSAQHVLLTMLPIAFVAGLAAFGVSTLKQRPS